MAAATWRGISLGRKLTKLPQIVQRGLLVSSLRVYLAQIAEHVSVIVEGRSSLLEFGDAFVEFALLAVGESEQKVRISELRFKLQSFIGLSDRLVVAPGEV